MNRPEPIELENNLGPDAVTGEINRVPWMAYDVDEMDIYIAELNAKLAEKDKEIESLKASHYAESVDAGMENRRLKRALYKACANWAWAEHVRYVDISDGSQGYKQVQERWEKMASKCIKKVEELK